MVRNRKVCSSTDAALWSTASRICSKQHVIFCVVPMYLFLHAFLVYRVHAYCSADTVINWNLSFIDILGITVTVHQQKNPTSWDNIMDETVCVSVHANTVGKGVDASLHPRVWILFWNGFTSLFNGLLTFIDYLMPHPSKTIVVLFNS